MMYRKLPRPVVEAIIARYCSVLANCTVQYLVAASFEVTEHSKTRLSGQFQLTDRFRNRLFGQFQLMDGLRKQLSQQFQSMYITLYQLFRQFQLKEPVKTIFRTIPINRQSPR